MTFVRNKQEKTGASSSQWRMAVYVRLSKEDGDKLESDSIQNQKRIIEQYIKYLQDQGEKLWTPRSTPTTATQGETLNARSING